MYIITYMDIKLKNSTLQSYELLFNPPNFPLKMYIFLLKTLY